MLIKRDESIESGPHVGHVRPDRPNVRMGEDN
jgi:hypothetical protein